MLRGHKLNSVYTKTLFLSLVLLTGYPSFLVFPQEINKTSLDFPFDVLEEKKNNTIYVFLDEKHFSRENLHKLFIHLSKRHPANSLGITVFSDKDLLLKQIKWELMGIYDGADSTPAKKEIVAEYKPRETGYLRAFYSRNSLIEYFLYSPGKDSIRLITVTQRNSKKFIHNEDFLFDSIKSGYVEAVKWILNQKMKINLNVSDSEDSTPLMWAIWLNHNEIANCLIEAGADVNVRTSRNSPLVTAIDAENYEAVKLLIANKVDVNATDKRGKTPLMGSASYCNFEITKLLLENGADQKLKDIIGQTVLDYVCKDKKIIELLSSFGGN